MRIVYVEDNQMNLALVERVARVGGHHVTSFSNGEVALEALKTETCDLILMDIELEGKMDGTQVVKALRARGDKRPIIAVTAYAMTGDKDRIMASGCDEYLPKPVPIAQFIALLAKYDPNNVTPVAPPIAKTKGTAPLQPPSAVPAVSAPVIQSVLQSVADLPPVKKEEIKQPPALDLRPPGAMPPVVKPDAEADNKPVSSIGLSNSPSPGA